MLTRDYMQCWTSAILRRQIRSYGDLKQYEKSVKTAIMQFLYDAHLPYHGVKYEELIVNPAGVITNLNAFLETSLTVEDLKRIYHKPLYKNPRSSWVDIAKAVLIYLKNHSERMNVPASAAPSRQ
jgi:hypothetical protein